VVGTDVVIGWEGRVKVMGAELEGVSEWLVLML